MVKRNQKSETEQSAFGGGFDPRANRAKKGEPRRKPIRHVYGVKIEKENGDSEWVVRGVLKGAAGMVQSALTVARDHPDCLMHGVIVLIDMGPSAEYEGNGQTD